MKGKINEMASMALVIGVIATILLPLASVASAQGFLSLPYQAEGISIMQGWRYNQDINPGADPRKHEGIDYNLPSGTSVRAAADGVARSWSQYSGNYGYGEYVVIYHNNGYYTLYAHLESVNSRIVRLSQSNTDTTKWTPVSRGEEIGKSGRTGAPNGGYHLHFELSTGYATGRLDPYDIYSTVDKYPPNGLMGQNNFWLTNPPSYASARIVTQSVLCKNQACSTTSVVPGDELTFVYSINNPTTSDISNVRLGAQIRTDSPQGAWQDDNINDQVRTITPGTTDYTRKFIIPTGATPGFYDIRGVILNHGTGVWIDSKELSHSLEVKAATTSPPYSSFYEGAIVTNGVSGSPAWLLKNNFRQKITDTPTFWSLYNSNGKRYYYFSDADINKIPQGADITIAPAAYDSFYEGSIVTGNDVSTPNYWLKDNFRRKIVDSTTFNIIYNSNGKKYWGFSSADINKIPQGADIKMTADLNSDGRVDSADLGILMSFWGSTSKPKADINQDGIVNSVDQGIMMSQWS